jgi:hypothetical protein
MGYTIQFASGKSVEFDNDPTDADIDAAYSDLHAQEEAPAPEQQAGPKPADTLGEHFLTLGKDILGQGVDLTQGIGKMVGGVVGGVTLPTIAAFTGEPVNFNEGFSTANQRMEEVFPSMQPKLNELTGLQSGPLANSIEGILGAVTHGVETAGDWLGDVTGSQNVAGATKIGANAAMLGMGIPGAKTVGKGVKTLAEKAIPVADVNTLREGLSYDKLLPPDSNLAKAEGQVKFYTNSLDRINGILEVERTALEDVGIKAEEAKGRATVLSQSVARMTEQRKALEHSTNPADVAVVAKLDKMLRSAEKSMESANKKATTLTAVAANKERKINELTKDAEIHEQTINALGEYVANHPVTKAEQQKQTQEAGPAPQGVPVSESTPVEAPKMAEPPVDPIEARVSELDAQIAEVGSRKGKTTAEITANLDEHVKLTQERDALLGHDDAVHPLPEMVSGAGELLKPIDEHQTLRDKLTEASATTTSPILKHMSNFLLKNETVGKFTKLYYEAKAEGSMTTHQRAGGVEVSARNPKALTTLNVIHESVHAATSGMLIAAERGFKFTPKVDKAIQDLRDLHADLDGTKFEDLSAGIFQSMMRNKVEGVPWELVRDAANELAVKALRNERELIAYGTTERDLMYALDQMNYTGKSEKSKLYTAIADMLGLESKAHKTALETLLNSAETLGEASKNQSSFQINKTGLDTLDNIHRYRTSTGDLGYRGTNAFIKSIDRAMRTFSSNVLLNSWGWANYFKHPLLYKLKDLADYAKRDRDLLVSDVMYGDPTMSELQAKKGFMMFRLNKLENHNSLHKAITDISHIDAAEVIPGLIKALEDGVDLHGNEHIYFPNGLKDSQKNLIRVMDRSAKRILEFENDMLTKRGLPPVSSLPGYFLKHIMGKYSVDVMANNKLISQEWHYSKAEAEANAKKQMQNDPTITAHVGERTEIDTNKGVFDTLTEVEQALQGGVGDPLQFLRSYMERRANTANAVGGHRIHRTTNRGFAGDTGGKPEVMGKDFLTMLPKAVAEYTNAIRVRQLAWDSGEHLNSVAARKAALMQPNAHKLGRMYLDHELGRTGKDHPITKALDDVGDWANDVVNDAYFNLTGKRVPGDLVPMAFGKVTAAAYQMVLTPAIATWVAQISAIANTGRMLAQHASNPVEMGLAGWRGLSDTLFNTYSKDSLEGMLYMMQHTDQFHKTIQHDLGKIEFNNDKASNLKTLKQWLLGEKQTQGSDTFTRVAAWNMAYQLERAQGRTGVEAWHNAGKMATENMIPMGSENLPLIYKRLGFVGTALSPLRGYGHGAATNILTDVKNVITERNWRSSSVLAMTTMAMVIQGGLIGAPLVAEYEFFRRYGVRMGWWGETDFPNLIQKITSYDNHLSRGTVAAVTGVDMSASARYQSIFKPLGDVTSNPSLLDSSVPISFGKKVIGSAAGVVKDTLGSTPDPEARKNWDNLLPRGVPRYIKEEIYNKNDKQQFGKRGEALLERGPKEKLADIVGSRSNEQAKETEDALHLDLVHKDFMAKKQRVVDLLLSESESDKSAGRKLAQKLMQDGQLTGKELRTMMKTQAVKAAIPHNVHSYVNEQGSISSNTQARNLREIGAR